MPAVTSSLKGIAERINLLKETIFDRVTYVSYQQSAILERRLTLHRVIRMQLSIRKGRVTYLQ